MPPVFFEDLIIGRRYFLRSSYDHTPPFGPGPIGSAAFQLLRIDPMNRRVFIFENAYGNPGELVVAPNESERWNYYPSVEGPPVAPRVALPYAGPMYVPEGTDSALMSNIHNDTELVNWGESQYGRYYTAANYAGLPVPKVSPTTREPIVNPKRYTVTRRAINNAFPLGSANAGLFGGRRRRRGKKTRKSRR